MRTVTFRSVYESVLRRMGYNPYADEPKEDVSQNVLFHINERIKFVWPVWDWPELNAVEWRAFRTVWTSTLQFSAGDELYYLGDSVTVPGSTTDPPTPGTHAGYYKCILTAPIGTLPTNATYFTLISSTFT